MAEYISMKQVPGGTVTAVDDRIVYDMNLSDGIIYGCEVSYTGNNMIHINAGYGIIKGGLFEMEDHTEYVDYADAGTVAGQIYLHFDASADDKLKIVKETTNTAHVLVQDDDANFDGGVYEIQLCTFQATTTTLQNVTQTFPVVVGGVDVLDTLEECVANNTHGKAAGAWAVKQLSNKTTTQLGDAIITYESGKYYAQWGADSASKKSLGSEAELLWTNPSPSSNFPVEETIALDLSNYDSVLISIYNDVSGIDLECMWFTVPTTTTNIIPMYYYNGTYRKVVVSTSGVSFERAEATTYYDNLIVQCNKPYKIWGLNTGIKDAWVRP